MIEKQNNFWISCMYLQEYKKGFAFLTKFRYFNYRGGLSRALKMQLKFFSQTIGLTQNIFFLKIAYIHSKQWFKEKNLKKKISKFGKLFSDPKGGPFASKKIEIFWKKNYPLKSFEMTQKGILKQKKWKIFFEIFWSFQKLNWAPLWIRNNDILLKMQILFCILEDTSMKYNNYSVFLSFLDVYNL